MNDPGPLHGADITADLRQPDMLGVGPGRSADAGPTIELTTDPAVHGAHGLLHVRRGAPAERRLVARIERPGAVWATCQSDDSIRIWGRFAPEADLVVRSTEAVRLVVRAPGGAMLAEPLLLAADGPPTTLQW